MQAIGGRGLCNHPVSSLSGIGGTTYERSVDLIRINPGAAGDPPTLAGKVERSAGKEGGAILPKAKKR